MVVYKRVYPVNIPCLHVCHISVAPAPPSPSRCPHVARLHDQVQGLPCRSPNLTHQLSTKMGNLRETEKPWGCGHGTIIVVPYSGYVNHFITTSITNINQILFMPGMTIPFLGVGHPPFIDGRCGSRNLLIYLWNSWFGGPHILVTLW